MGCNICLVDDTLLSQKWLYLNSKSVQDWVRTFHFVLLDNCCCLFRLLANYFTAIFMVGLPLDILRFEGKKSKTRLILGLGICLGNKQLKFMLDEYLSELEKKIILKVRKIYSQHWLMSICRFFIIKKLDYFHHVDNALIE